MPKNLLTAKAIENAKPKAKAYRLRDGEGLFLYVPPSGASSWQFRYKFNGRGQTATLGRAERIGLAEARRRADEARTLVERGEHVTVARRVAKARAVAATSSTFAVLAKEWVAAENLEARWSPRYRHEVEASIENHLSELGPLPIAVITAAVAAPILQRCRRKTPDMAAKVHQRLRSIFDFAVEQGLIPGNPLPAPRRRPRRDRGHLPAVLGRPGVGEILRRADRAEVGRGVRRAHLLTVFTCQRVGEVVGARWDEINLDAGTWAIPRERMKRKDLDRGPHEVPIPPGLLVMMREWRRVDGEKAAYVCPTPDGKRPITREAVEKFYRRTLALTGKHSPHSWRSVFSTWGRDAGKEGDLIEAQLDHVVGNKVASAYDRAKRLELRRILMAWHEGELLAARDGAAVVSFREKTS